jgi:hypothetical protein
MRRVDGQIRARSRYPLLVAHNASASVVQPKERAHMFYDEDRPAVARLLGLDIVDWSLLLVAIGLTALLVVLA